VHIAKSLISSLWPQNYERVYFYCFKLPRSCNLLYGISSMLIGSLLYYLSKCYAEDAVESEFNEV
jgi:hypothetical protein